MRTGIISILTSEDDGQGVPLDEKEKIFRKGYGKGTGLGLFLSKEILSITGISIREIGEPGKETRLEMLSTELADSGSLERSVQENDEWS